MSPAADFRSRIAPMAGVACCIVASAHAGGGSVSSQELERAYWACMELDARNHLRGERMDEQTLVRCAAISKALQVRRFGDDFGKLHEWTQAHRAQAGAAAAAQGSPSSPGPDLLHGPEHLPRRDPLLTPPWGSSP